MTQPRDLIYERLRIDLMGPVSDREVLGEKPSDRYLTGILYPQRQEMGPEDDDRLAVAGADGDDEGSSTGVEEDIPTSFMKKPSACGLSFRCESVDAATFQVRITGGKYTRSEREADDTVGANDESNDTISDEAASESKFTTRYVWTRDPVDLPVSVAVTTAGSHSNGLVELKGFRLHQTSIRLESGWLVTIVLVNGNVLTSNKEAPSDDLALFQASVEVSPMAGTRIIASPEVTSQQDEDAEINELLYRDVRQFAVGHTCSAEWEEDSAGRASVARTTWLPRVRVPLVSADGSEYLRNEIASATPNPLAAETLAECREDLAGTLEPLVRGYEKWIANEVSEIPKLPANLQPIARRNLKCCRESADRMRAGLDLLRTDAATRDAFRLMNRAMSIQREWIAAKPLIWHPFQIAFILQSLLSISDRRSPDREIMDLLWFPTGGGKTEAYLGLIAFTLFLRRLRHMDEPNRASGIACIMRYTLRLLTLQQFQRASALILACELIRRGIRAPAGSPDLHHHAPIGIGLWVGKKATARNFAEGAEALRNASTHNTPAQLTNCPCCKEVLTWDAIESEERIRVRCLNEACELGTTVTDLPVWTLDENVYRNGPALLIGTVDKFAQIVRFQETAAIFNIGIAAPPELIIQDELHLISGPLGTLAALYEAAIDLICARDGYKAKIIGSTATIRRASDQVRALFERSVAQFPPPGRNADDSCFAVVPKTPRDRLYVGITTAGRSAKFTLQWTFASLLQSASAIDNDDVRDGYHTLVGYFNSLRELGGALVLVQKDVEDTLKLLAGWRNNERPRELKEIVELTSRVTQREIRTILDQLELDCSTDGAVDLVLATNMLSVGVDVGRLALMVVLGQPKSIAEYIQATSRVGRGENSGLIVTVLNNAKTRDRSRFETFGGWHRAIYRGVEATSVTPFASRARDRGLHAALVAVARHLVPGMNDSPRLDSDAAMHLQNLATRIRERVYRIDEEETQRAGVQMEELITQWQQRSDRMTDYWNDFKFTKTLMISAEKAAAKDMRRIPGNPWPTPNSMRTIEPGTPFRLAEVLRTSNDATEEQ